MIAGWYGMAHVKWLAGITALTEPFDGYQQTAGYRLYDADGDGRRAGDADHAALAHGPARHPRLHDARALRRRRARAGCEGRAWSGWAPVERVEVSTDGGATWADAELEQPLGERAWRGWSFAWDATPGEHVICSRATDAAGNAQPVEPAWNLKGYANNGVERIPVTVR